MQLLNFENEDYALMILVIFIDKSRKIIRGFPF